MRDVASSAGVSLKTVSRVVNSENGVRPATAARVEAAIAQLGFARNDVARSLRHGRANALGLVIEDVANPFYSAIARTVEDAAHARNHILITGSCEEDAERERQLVLRLLRRSVDALLIVPAGDDHRYLQPELDDGTPIVFLDRPPRGRGGRHRPARQRRRRPRGGRAPARATATSGSPTSATRRRCTPPPSASPATATRSRDAGLARREELVGAGSHDAASAERGRARPARAARRPPPDRPLHRQQPQHRRRPARAARRARPVALVGFDDFELADMLATRHRRPSRAGADGRIAAELAYERLDGERAPAAPHRSPAQLVVRGSGEVRAMKPQRPPAQPDPALLPRRPGDRRAARHRRRRRPHRPRSGSARRPRSSARASAG